jgi:hypothetical protein
MKQYAVLTNENGDIVTIVSYETHEELHNKTRQAIFDKLEVTEEDVVIIPYDKLLDVNHGIGVKKNPTDKTYIDEFYLTPSEVV